MARDENYTLMVGEKGAERLRILNKVRNPYTLQSLSKLGNLQGRTILDLGCGIGIMTCELARRVGNTGKVIAVDISREQLNIAEKYASQSGCHNIEFVEMSANDIENLQVKFDVIYSRFLLAHLTDPIKIITKMINLLNIGGALFLEEPTGYQVTFSDPPSPAFDQWKFFAVRQQKIFDTDFSIGCKLFSMLSDFGLSNISFNLIQPFLKLKEEKDSLWLGLQEAIPSYTSHKLGTEAELLTVIENLKMFAKNERYIVASLQYLQIIGLKL